MQVEANCCGAACTETRGRFEAVCCRPVFVAGTVAFPRVLGVAQTLPPLILPPRSSRQSASQSVKSVGGIDVEWPWVVLVGGDSRCQSNCIVLSCLLSSSGLFHDQQFAPHQKLHSAEQGSAGQRRAEQSRRWSLAAHRPWAAQGYIVGSCKGTYRGSGLNRTRQASFDCRLRTSLPDPTRVYHSLLARSPCLAFGQLTTVHC